MKDQMKNNIKSCDKALEIIEVMLDQYPESKFLNDWITARFVEFADKKTTPHQYLYVRCLLVARISVLDLEVIEPLMNHNTSNAGLAVYLSHSITSNSEGISIKYVELEAREGDLDEDIFVKARDEGLLSWAVYLMSTKGD